MNSVTEVKEKADGVLITAVLFIVLSSLAVGLRLFTRAIVKMCFGSDDWAIISALLLFYIIEGLEIYAFLQGKDATDAMDPKFARFWYYSYIEGIFYCLTAMTTNMSILCLYRRIFVTEPFRRISLIMIFVNILWFIPGTLVEIFICVPIKSAWDTSEDGQCIRYGTFWMTLMALELLIDAIILFLSIREISTLKMVWNQKLVVVMMFMSGGFVIITGIVRIPLSYKPSATATIDLSTDALWLNIHLGSAIICACLPTYRPIFRKGSTFFRQLYSSRDVSHKEVVDLHESSLKTSNDDVEASYKAEGPKIPTVRSMEVSSFSK